MRHVLRTNRTSFTAVDNGWVRWSILEYHLWLDASSSCEDVSYIWLVANEELILSRYCLKRSDADWIEGFTRCEDVQSTILGWRIESSRGIYFWINLKWEKNSERILRWPTNTIDRQRLNFLRGCPFLVDSTAEENWSRPFPLRLTRSDFAELIQGDRISCVVLLTNRSSSLKSSRRDEWRYPDLVDREDQTDMWEENSPWTGRTFNVVFQLKIGDGHGDFHDRMHIQI